MSAASSRTILVTGAGGFLGANLLSHIRGQDDPPHLVATDMHRGDESLAQWCTCDLTDEVAVRALLEDIEPDGMIHLAGVTGEGDPEISLAVNVGACRNIFSTIRNWSVPPRVLIVGSAAMYGITKGGEEVVDEDRPLLSNTVYGVTKIMQERWALMMASRFELPVVCVRPFNIMGPGQPARLMPSAFLTQVQEVLAGRASSVRVGNTSTRRDFTDVRDVVSAMWMLMHPDAQVDGQVFNIASGEGLRISDIVEACIELGGRDIQIVQDPSRMRRLDVPSIVGDSTRLRNTTGWSCRIGWRQSLEDMWRVMRSSQG